MRLEQRLKSAQFAGETRRSAEHFGKKGRHVWNVLGPSFTKHGLQKRILKDQRIPGGREAIERRLAADVIVERRG